jgi:hypothetical protein
MRSIAMSLALALCFGGIASANLMTFNGGPTTFTTYTEDGMLLTNNIGNGSWDAQIWSNALHLDDGMVTLTMVGGSPFDLESLLVNYNAAPINFNFSGGSSWTYAASGPANTLIDFSAIAGASNLSWVQIDGNNPWCTQIDNISANPVPVPGAVLLGMLGLSVAGARLRKRA